MEDDQRERRELAHSPNLPPRYDVATAKVSSNVDSSSHFNITKSSEKKQKKKKLKKSIEEIIAEEEMKMKESKDDLMARYKQEEELDAFDYDSDDDDEDILDDNKEKYRYLPITLTEEKRSKLFRGCTTERSVSIFGRLFWLRSPTLHLRLIQGLVLSQAIYLTLFLVVFLSKGWTRWGGWVLLALLPPSLLTVFWFIPSCMPIYTLIRYIDLPSTLDIVEALRTHKRNIRDQFRNKVQEVKQKSLALKNKTLTDTEAATEAEDELGIKYKYYQTISKEELQRWKKLLTEEEQTVAELPLVDEESSDVPMELTEVNINMTTDKEEQSETASTEPERKEDP